MSEKLFSIRCETCGSRLAVRDVSLIGHILSCPKCSSMVMVQPPADWVPPDGSGVSASAAPSNSASTSSSTAEISASAATPAPTPAGLAPTTAAEAATLRSRWADAAAVSPPPASDPAAASANDVPLRGEDWLTPRQRFVRHHLPKIAAGVAAVIATVALWYAFAPGDEPVEEPQAANTQDEQHDAAPPDEQTTPIDVPAPPVAPQEVDPPVLVHSLAPRAPEPDDPREAIPVSQESIPAAPQAPAIDPDAVAADPQRPDRDPLPVIDVPARLNDPIVKLDYVKSPLLDFLGVMSTFSTIPITLDVDALVESGIRVDAPVTARGPKLTVGQALDAGLAPLKLRYLVVDQHVVVTTIEPDAASPPVRREVGDLVGSEVGGTARLATLIQRLVEPTSWQTQRTTTSLRVDGTALVIVQTPRVVRKIDALLAALRAARRDPVGAAVAPPPALETRAALARDALGKKITLNYTTPTSLAKILARLSESAKLTIVVDWQALAAENIGPATPARMTANDVPVERAFAALVEPLGLAVRIIDARTVEITTQDELAGNPEVAALPLADLATDRAAFASIAEKLSQQFGPPIVLDRDDADNSTDAGVAWHLDEASKTLFLRAPQDSLAQLEAVFRDARAKQKR